MSSDVYGLAATALALLTGSPPAAGCREWDGIDATQAEELEDASVGASRLTRPAGLPPRPSWSSACVEGWGATLPTGLLTFCFSDIEGSTAMWDGDPTGMAEALVRHDELIAEHVESTAAI